MNISSHIFFICIVLSNFCNIVISECNYCYMHHNLRKTDEKFHQKSIRFWELDQISKTWVEIKLPFDLVSCVNDKCTVVDSIQEVDEEKIWYPSLRVRKRLSLTRISETSIWVTGHSGSIYERFWNGIQWVIAPHHLPISAGYAVSVFVVKHTILALSDSGHLFQMQLTDESQPYWVEFMPDYFDMEPGKEAEQISDIRLSCGVVSNDMETMYFCTKNGSLLELHMTDSPRWINHGQPPGANVAAITDANNIRSGVVYILGGAGDLYEYDKASKPSWKKHIPIHAPEKDNLLAPIRGCTLQGLSAASIFLLTKRGELAERRLHQRKWKWTVHGSPNGHPLSSITCTTTSQDSNNLLYLTSTTGFIFEYQIPKYSGSSQNQEHKGKWLNHKHPPHAKLARAISGLQIQVGRMIFPLDDGRLAELHLSGFGGENFSPTNTKRKSSSVKYVWSIIEAPESEGWNAEYCTEERGPANCILGTKDETVDSRWRKNMQNYLSDAVSIDNSSGDSSSKSDEDYKLVKSNFRLRSMQQGKSFFLITDVGLTFEYVNTENIWLWLKHEHSGTMGGVVGNYNNGMIMFVVDENGNLFMRESHELAWINCSAMKKGKQVIGGPPWDGKIPQDEMLFFISKTGKLLQFTVALRKFKWKDCRNPLGVKIGCIADQGGLRENIVFVIGRNGRLYQYNKITQLWHQHYHQSQHLVLKIAPGSAMARRSLFMLSEEGGLVEYMLDGWSWIEHGTPYTNVTLVGAPGPTFAEQELFLIGSDGNVHMRYLDQGEWKWKDFGFPQDPPISLCIDIHRHCNPKVTSTRALPFSENAVIFELVDGRLGEMQKMEGKYWAWSRTIGTPTSLCIANF